jgi:hypothetical protein
MIGHLNIENDARKHIRRFYNRPLRFFYKSRQYKALVANIGRGGAFILTKEKFALGGKITLVVPGRKTPKTFKAIGWIIRISRQGIGVSFERRFGRERRSDLDRRTGLDRRRRKKKKN